MLRRLLDLSNIAGVVGVGLLAYGLGLLHPALPFIIVGLGCVIFAIRSVPRAAA